MSGPTGGTGTAQTGGTGTAQAGGPGTAQETAARLLRRIGGGGAVTVDLDTTVTAPEERRWEGLPGALVAGDPRLDRDAPYAVLGGPGTGKTSLIVDTAVSFLRAGGRADELMVVTPSKESAAAVRTAVVDRLRAEDSYATSGSPVRSVHSWAFSILTTVESEQHGPLPRLMSGAEHDAQIRELLRGHVADNRGDWPDEIRPALPLTGFARQLRDLLLRAAERGLGPDDLEELGRRHDRPMWTAAASFLREYRQVQELSGTTNLNASELLHTALAALRADDARERTDVSSPAVARWRDSLRLVLVDDAHNLDPAAGEFIDLFLRPGVTAVVTGDPDQCVFHFRGADEQFLTRHAATGDHRVTLSRSHRLTAGPAAAVRRLQERLPASGAAATSLRVPLTGVAGEREAGGDGDRPAVGGAAPAGIAVHRAPTVTAERLVVTDHVRRAHVVDEVPWSRIAVIVRSVADIPALRRTLLSHGVPVTVDPTSVVLAEQQLVSVLLLALEALLRPLTTAEVQRLVESPLGGADPVMVRRLERSVARAVLGTGMRAMECVSRIVLREATPTEEQQWTRFFGPREQGVLDRIRAVVDAGRDAHRAGGSVETVLWKVWQAADLSASLQQQALRGGTLGSQADRDLDAVMSLFDLAGDIVERNPNVSLRTFVEDVRAQELPTGGRDRRGVAPDAVEILPAHAAAGREWDVVVVAGVQEDSWPAGLTVGGLFGQVELVDALDRGIEPGAPVARAAGALQEERRLFLLAVSRARHSTLVTATGTSTDDADVPSRFLREIEESGAVQGTGAEDTGDGEDTAAGQADAGGGAGSEGTASTTGAPTSVAGEGDDAALPRVLAVEPLVAELRDAVCDPDRPGHERDAAARCLGRFAGAGVHGADPDDWWGVLPPSTTAPVVPEGTPVRLSPSAIDRLSTCGFTAFIESVRSDDAPTEPMLVGQFIHALAEAFADGLDVDTAHRLVETVIPELVDAPPAVVGHRVETWRQGVTRLHTWITARGGADVEVAVEQALEQDIGQTARGYRVVLAGRADRLETGPDGTLVIDFKTGTAVTKQQAEDSAQLASYQLLVTDGGGTAAGAVLVYPGKDTKTMTVRRQSAATPERVEEFRASLLDLADTMIGPEFTAAADGGPGAGDTASLSPATTQGRQVVE
ncbi:ATP-dependent helicase [Corynebacterium bovis]|uniref:DNA 3'-5' helicase n=3 Tax=Corynebacterium bovis TaxID=36808 RepID=A0A426Q2F1_9CORY|nr:ATP-dependent DNA helicase [Corynebacterium bovis]RRO90357.1 ATP-dependent helicase [Corynebacterium bovis]RRQ01292.1 ATP-dependent helicase [Corynebacterium bovis]RRQ01775.1 ATP-dependent helicase [Corynebacterium bovis]RRQ02013.1 ATP-dependent helicase [Corynebacterium bovis]RRQ05912.1 ATP-dependent helicase [Corynebacterium bovis]